MTRATEIGDRISRSRLPRFASVPSGDLGELMAAQKDARLMAKAGRKPKEIGLHENQISLEQVGIYKNLADRARASFDGKTMTLFCLESFVFVSPIGDKFAYSVSTIVNAK